MQLGFYFDQSRCTGCATCVVACKDWHDVPAGPASYIRVNTFEEGKYPNVRVASLINLCWQCANPTCIPACAVNAISKREDGIVVVDREACLGKDECGLCEQACPYQAPQFRAEPNARMEKCEGCPDRLEAGKPPICVAGCPLRALDFGPIDELKTKYGASEGAYRFIYSSETKPSVVFKPRFTD